MFDVWSVESSGGKLVLKEAGWAVVPVFRKKDRKLYVRSGYFQVPLLWPPVNADLIKEMAKYEDATLFLDT